VEQESSQCVSLASKKSSTSFMLLQLLQIPPSDEEKLKFLKENSNFDPAIDLIVAPFSDKFKTVLPVINLPLSFKRFVPARK